jgi:hypothetical protein
MEPKKPEELKGRIDLIERLSRNGQGSSQWFEAGGLAISVLHDTVGYGHPLLAELNDALKAANYYRVQAASKNVVTLYNEGALTSPRLAIAHEIEGGLLDIAQEQVQEVERSTDPTGKCLKLAIAAFIAGAALEDALRRLCEANNIVYDTQHTSISKLQAALFQPSKGITVISSSDNKQITAWGDTRNKADHGKFNELTYSEVFAMVIGIRGFLEKHLP